MGDGQGEGGTMQEITSEGKTMLARLILPQFGFLIATNPHLVRTVLEAIAAGPRISTANLPEHDRKLVESVAQESGLTSLLANILSGDNKSD